MFFLLTSVTTAQQHANLTQNKDPNHVLQRNVQHFSEQAFLFDLYYGDNEFTMTTPQPHLDLEYDSSEYYYP